MSAPLMAHPLFYLRYVVRVLTRRPEAWGKQITLTTEGSSCETDRTALVSDTAIPLSEHHTYDFVLFALQGSTAGALSEILLK